MKTFIKNKNCNDCNTKLTPNKYGSGFYCPRCEKLFKEGDEIYCIPNTQTIESIYYSSEIKKEIERKRINKTPLHYHKLCYEWGWLDIFGLVGRCIHNQTTIIILIIVSSIISISLFKYSLILGLVLFYPIYFILKNLIFVLGFECMD